MLNAKEQNNQWSFSSWVAKGGMKGYMKFVPTTGTATRTQGTAKVKGSPGKYNCQRIPRAKRRAFRPVDRLGHSGSKPLQLSIRKQVTRRTQRFAKRPEPGSVGFTFRRTRRATLSIEAPPGFESIVIQPSPVHHPMEESTVIQPSPIQPVEEEVVVEPIVVEPVEEPIVEVDAETPVVEQLEQEETEEAIPVEEEQTIPVLETEQLPLSTVSDPVQQPVVSTTAKKVIKTRKAKKKSVSTDKTTEESATPRPWIWLALLALTALLGSQLLGSSDTTNMVVVGLVGTASILFFMYSLVNMRADDLSKSPSLADERAPRVRLGV